MKQLSIINARQSTCSSPLVGGVWRGAGCRGPGQRCQPQSQARVAAAGSSALAPLNACDALASGFLLS